MTDLFQAKTLRINTNPPAAHMAFSVKVIMNRKNNYSFPAFADEKGECTIEVRDMLTWFDAECAFALMDYINIREGAVGVQIKPIDHNGLLAAKNAYARFKDHFPYPKGYEVDLERAIRSPELDPSLTVTHQFMA
jgi:hypothetical protein